MSEVMLHGVLNMPPDCWSNDAIDVMQRHSRYKQASEEIYRLTALVSKYEAAIDEHKEYTESLYGRSCTAGDLKLWQTREK